MPIKVKYAKAMTFVGDLFKNSQVEFRTNVSQNLGDKINEVIESGTSPVAGQGRFPDYSDGYKSAIARGKVRGTDGAIYPNKRPRPVNLFVSGSMLGSQKVSITNKGVNVSYSSKFAEYHNETGRVLRRMLPTKKGEIFSVVITKFLKETAVSAVAKFLRR